jgi:RNA-directed DNA polymerase
MLELTSFNPHISKKRIQRFLQCNDIISLSHCLQLKPEVLESALMSERNYHQFPIPKKKGGKRMIYAPYRPLKDIQERLNFFLNLIYNSYAPDYVHGFIKKTKNKEASNIVSNAQQHVSKAWVLNVDIQDFFPSINAENIRTALLARPINMHSKEAASIIALLATQNWKLPAGSPCSPVLSNIVFYSMDKQLKALADNYNLIYTRYADDLTFSGSVKMEQKTIEEMQRILENAGFRINPRKIRLQSKHGAQFVTGIKVNEKLNIDRKYYRNLRAIMHNWHKHGIEQVSEQYYAARKHIFRNKESLQLSFINSIGGKLGFLQSVKQEDAAVRNLSELFTKLKTGKP